MDLLYFIQNLRNPVFDTFFSLYTHIGSSLLVIGILCFTFWCIDKKLAYKICFTYFISGLLVQTLKITFRIQRPWILDSRLTPVASAVNDATGYSFPSGHTQSTTGLFSSIALHMKKKSISTVAGLIIFLLMFSRMYLGCHTLWDVLVSFGITLLCSIVASVFYDIVSGSQKIRLWTASILTLVSMGVLGYSYYVVLSGLSTAELAMDAFKAGGAGLSFGLAWYAENQWIQYDPKTSRSIPIMILKFLFGMIGAAMILKGFALIPMDEILNHILTYAFAIGWIVAIYPLILKKLQS